MTRRHLHLFFALASALALSAAVASLLPWLQARSQAQGLAGLPASPSTNEPVDLRLQRAAKARAAGDIDEAVRLLQALVVRTDLRPEQAGAVRYNLGNALLLQAGDALARHDDDRALTLLQLAKQRYRERLRMAPHDWDARHNLERALRLAPERAPPPPREEPTNVQRITIEGRGMGAVDLP